MAIATYSDLIAELGDWLNRADLSAKLPTFIRLFEARMNRTLRTPGMETTFSFTTIADQDTYALASGVRELRSFTTTASPDPDLKYVIRGTNIVFTPTPTGAYDISYSAYRALIGLDDGNATNWLLDEHPDAYLYGSLAEAYAYLKDDPHAQKYLAISEEIVGEITLEANERRLPAGPLQMRPARGSSVSGSSGGALDDPGDLTSYIH